MRIAILVAAIFSMSMAANARLLFQHFAGGTVTAAWVDPTGNIWVDQAGNQWVPP